MASKKIAWDETGKRYFRAGVSHGVLYPLTGGAYQKGEGWNGLTKVDEKPTGAEATPTYANNHKYIEMISQEEFGCTIEAYTYPDSFEACQGYGELAKGVVMGQQSRTKFGLTYRGEIGNDTDGIDHGYIINCVYNCSAKPSERSNATINKDPEAQTMSWEVTTTPVNVTGGKPTAIVKIDSTKIGAESLKIIEAVLYGCDDATGLHSSASSQLASGCEPTLLMPDQIAQIITATGEDSMMAYSLDDRQAPKAEENKKAGK